MDIKTLVFLGASLFSISVFGADQKARSGDQKVNVNQATMEQLDKGLLGVGPRIAMEIVKHRDQHGPYQSFDDLDKVKYVGSRMLDKNKNRIVFD
ncbi:helix-hairpin-helix domain-containing protein [Endozoicomonas sp. YOMI1]|uniref:ComEA family DNA-binding protein n=1 Tax=Endozoicomonas sp. YOMI1 TaxID=2828739 RepID=UPI0021496AEF|nr:helix-hairpin-helix domain-containing protein [Endozoicomonas sp. YOMI1]